jgi:hypothetical protein
MARPFVFIAAIAVAFVWSDSLVTSADDTASDLFRRRVLPILKSKDPSSCTECHFGGVEIQAYIHKDQATTFAALRDAGLIDVKSPDDSKILRFIRRHTDGTSELLVKVRRAEHLAFQSWIRAAVRDPTLLATKGSEARIGTELPVEVIRHMRRDHVLESFVENIWSQIGRCINCHSPDRNARLVKKHGEQVSWIRPNDPAATLAQCVEQFIVDTDDPEESLILLKPVGEVEHGGGPKFAPGSQTDKNFRRFLNDYAAVVNGKYKRPGQLPKPSGEVARLTGQHLRIVDLPASLGNQFLRVDLFRREGNGWSTTRWGTADNPIAGEKRLWQNMVTAVAPVGSPRAARIKQNASLPAGRYLARIYVDRTGKLKKNRDVELGDEDLVGQVEFDGDWPAGYQPPKIIRGPQTR